MKNSSYFINKIILSVLVAGHLLSCGDTKPSSANPGKKSTATGIPFNEKGGFQVEPFKNQAVGSHMVFIEGGSTIMGVFGEADSPKREVTVTSFYLKETEVFNLEWREYVEYLKQKLEGLKQKSEETEEAEEGEEGEEGEQAEEGAETEEGKETEEAGETEGVKEAEEVYKAALLSDSVWVRELGYNDPYVRNYGSHPGFWYYPVVGVTWKQANDYCNWLTERVNRYLAEKEGKAYDLEEGEPLPIQSGLLVAGYRLPTEAEWDYAARAMVGTQSLDFVQATQRVYPWGDGLSLRGPDGPWKGKYMANFKRSKGNYKGIAGETPGSAPTSYVYLYPPNDLGLYDMGGNVSEWVVDLYRPLSFDQFDDFNPARRDEMLDPAKTYDSSYSLINNKARVYKGASWKDCAYWAQIGTRRYLDEDSCTATIGFRYAMNSMGDSDQNKK